MPCIFFLSSFCIFLISGYEVSAFAGFGSTLLHFHGIQSALSMASGRTRVQTIAATSMSISTERYVATAPPPISFSNGTGTADDMASTSALDNSVKEDTVKQIAGAATGTDTFTIISAGNQAVLDSIDRSIRKNRKKRNRYLAKHDKCKRTVEGLEEKKWRLLQVCTNFSGNDATTTSTTASTAIIFTESAHRSAIKAMVWRIIAGSVTLATSLQFSGSLRMALSIVGSDFFSKALTMFIGERAMNKSQVGRGKGADDVGRSLAKALLWRLFAICNTLAMSFVVAKDLSLASKIAGSDAIFKTGLMFVYERVWAKIEFGKEYQIDGWKPNGNTMQLTWFLKQKMHTHRLMRKARALVPSLAS